MKQLSTLLISFILCSQLSNAQVEIAPDFTATDIEGNTWTLYEILDQGKSVIMDVSATWCGPCWAFHQTHTLDNLYETYGPNGTDEVVVLFVEGDAQTTLEDLNGTGSSTLGNWVEGTSYPIIDDASISDAYNVSAFPTIFHICPSRLLTEIERVSVDEYIAAHRGCPKAEGNQNAGIIAYESFEGTFCRENTFAPQFKFQNLGLDSMMSATITMSINDVPTETLNWTGGLKTYQLADAIFEEITIMEDSKIDFVISSVNGQPDEYTSNNNLQVNTELSKSSETPYIVLELTTDSFPVETYWELLDENGVALYTGGNPGIFTQTVAEGTYPDIMTTYTHQLPLPNAGCYEFVLYDFYSDGICCVYGEGGYVLKNESGEMLAEGGAFETASIADPFNLEGTPSINNNASIISYNGTRGVFCGQIDFQPSIVLQNVGASPITSAKLRIKDQDDNEIQVFDWTGDIATGRIAAIQMNSISLASSTDLSIEIVEINGEEDPFDYKNTFEVSLTRTDVSTEYRDMTVELQTDNYGYELYWEVVDDMGEVIASGGNENVGPNGGGAGVATPADPGAYANGATIVENVQVPMDGCYSILVVDDYGDGLEAGAYVRLVDDLQNTMVEFTGVFVAPSAPYEVKTFVSTQDVEALANIQLSPNPAKNQTRLNFHLNEARFLDIALTNTLGQRVSSIQASEFPAGLNSIDINLGQLSTGIYFISLQDGQQITTRRLIITH
ncbi:MAG: T9SS type A sorting domain-containing protein [Bacteroidota bacterium]